MKKLLLSVMVLSAAAMYAQQINRCSSMDYRSWQLANDPTLQAKWDAVEQDCADYAQAYPNGYAPRAVVRIPVIVHVVYQNSTENISFLRIQEQIQVLNEDYRKMNTDAANIPSQWQSIAADCEVEFCLAQQDPNGNWTDGVERVSTTVSTWTDDDLVKHASSGGADAWDRTKYLNLWVCDLGSMLLGYAQFPGGAAATDGVVIHYRYTGKTGATSPYNKGRTATHEVGHWLGLWHIWGDDGTSCTGSDNIADTPNQADEHYGCPSGAQVSCSNGPNGDMWMNYMDYTDDACMYMFTAGQKTRIWAVLNGSRLPLQSSNRCSIVGVDELTLAHMFSVYPSPTNGQVTLDFGLAAPSEYDITVYNALGEQVQYQHVPMLSERTMTLDLSAQAAGIYFVEVKNQSEKVTRRVVVE